MAQQLTQARPYARAAFESASADDTVSSWQEQLKSLALLAANEKVRDYILNPKVTSKKAAAFFTDVLGNALSDKQKNFVMLLAEDKQLGLLVEIEELFINYQAEDNNAVNVQVESAQAFNQKYREQLKAALQTKLNKKIQLSYSINPDLLGGAVLRTSEWVMDGSVKGKLEQLKTTMIG
jgi:F-type H+-transporting ATPase subunit delta